MPVAARDDVLLTSYLPLATSPTPAAAQAFKPTTFTVFESSSTSKTSAATGGGLPSLSLSSLSSTSTSFEPDTPTSSPPSSPTAAPLSMSFSQSSLNTFSMRVVIGGVIGGFFFGALCAALTAFFFHRRDLRKRAHRSFATPFTADLEKSGPLTISRPRSLRAQSRRVRNKSNATEASVPGIPDLPQSKFLRSLLKSSPPSPSSQDFLLFSRESLERLSKGEPKEPPKRSWVSRIKPPLPPPVLPNGNGNSSEPKVIPARKSSLGMPLSHRSIPDMPFTPYTYQTLSRKPSDSSIRSARSNVNKKLPPRPGHF